MPHHAAAHHPKAHHLEIAESELEGNSGLGRYVFLPGSRGRAADLAQRFSGHRVLENRRGHDIHLGQLRRGSFRVDVAAVATGMGCPSVDIIVTELLSLGARRLLRVGTAGTLQKSIRVGDLVIATGAVRDEATSDAYAPRELPAIADPLMARALEDAAIRLGLGQRTFSGIVHTKDSLFGREFGQGPDAERNRQYVELLSRAGVLASEMEAAHLMVLGTVHRGEAEPVETTRSGGAALRVGTLLAIIGSPEGFASRHDETETEERMLQVAVEGILDLAQLELDGSGC